MTEPRQLRRFGQIDLHLHSTASDGTLAPRAIVEHAALIGLQTISITDHDSIGGVAEAQATGRSLGVDIVTGVELSADAPAGDCHILGYHVRVDDHDFTNWLETRRTARIERGQEIVKRVNAELRRRGSGTVPQLWWDDVAKRANIAEGGAVGRPHVADALVAIGAVTSRDDAFATLLGNGMAGDVHYDRVKPNDVIEIIRRAGGVAVLAHPTYFPDFERQLPALIEAGLGGLECVYGDYAPHLVEQLCKVATSHGLAITGGSDFHGPGLKAGSGEIGVPNVSADLLESLLARSTATPR
ncbi:MAG: PHP domain-containing protein [Proteobacteria bacterium]|nr:PHP domain-containing protein [Pseudomonadota bacterium]